MSTSGRRFTLFLLFVYSALFANVCFSKDIISTQSDVTIVLGEWPPYIFSDKPFSGTLPHIVSAAYELQGINTSYKFIDWDTAYENVKKSKNLVSIGWVQDASRAKDMYFSDPISHITLSFFHRKSMKFRWDRLDDLKVHRLGYVKGFSYGTKFNEALNHGALKAKEYDNYHDAFMAVLRNEIDLLPSDQMVGQFALRELGEQRAAALTFDERSLLVSPVHMIASKTNPAGVSLVDDFNKGLKKLKENGRFRRILSNAHLIDDIDNLAFLTEDNAPLNYMEGNTIKGISVATVSEILKELESNVKLEKTNVLPWARAYKTALKQDNVALFSIIKTAEREPDFQWVGPIYRANVVLFAKKDSYLKRNAIGALSDKIICAVREDVGAQLIASLGHSEENTHYPSSAEQCAKMLMLGRVDLWAYGADTGRWHLSNAGADLSQYEEALHLHESFRYIAFSKNVPAHVVAAFQKTLDYLQLSGRLQQIISNELQ